jgi:hypothetical protein
MRVCSQGIKCCQQDEVRCRKKRYPFATHSTADDGKHAEVAHHATSNGQPRVGSGPAGPDGIVRSVFDLWSDPPGSVDASLSTLSELDRFVSSWDSFLRTDRDNEVVGRNVTYIFEPMQHPGGGKHYSSCFN